jgi:hypothetical protein
MFRCVIQHLQEHLITCSKQPALYSVVVRVALVMPSNIKYSIFYLDLGCFLQ